MEDLVVDLNINQHLCNMICDWLLEDFDIKDFNSLKDAIEELGIDFGFRIDNFNQVVFIVEPKHKFFVEIITTEEDEDKQIDGMLLSFVWCILNYNFLRDLQDNGNHVFSREFSLNICEPCFNEIAQMIKKESFKEN